MDINFNNIELDNTNSLFDKEYFEDMDLNDDMEKIYSLVRNDEDFIEYEKEINISKMRVENHKKYHNIKIKIFDNLPNSYYLEVKKIKKIYNEINEKKLLNSNYKETEEIKYKLIQLENLISQFTKKVEKNYQILVKENDNLQKSWSYNIFKNMNIDKEDKNKLLKYYEELVIISSNFKNNIIEDYKIELKRKKYIERICKILKKKELELISNEKNKELELLNRKIERPKEELDDKIRYLSKLIISDSKYIDDFNKFKKLCSTIKSYDPNNLEEARETYKLLCLQDKIDIFVKRLERLFLEEVNDKIKGDNYKLLEKDLDNISKTVNIIENNYYDILNKEELKYIRNIKRSLKNKIVNVEETQNKLNELIKQIWNKYLTDINSYDSNNDYHFICSNNQFIEPIYETVLLTNKIIDKLDNYGDYQIGFICNAANNILYMTNQKDIIDVEENEKKLLKLPIQIEEKIDNLNDCYKIALNGTKVVFIGVYFIDDGDLNKLTKAEDLSKIYNIPLIKIKRDN